MVEVTEEVSRMVSEEASHRCMVAGQCDLGKDVDTITALAKKCHWWTPRSVVEDNKEGGVLV
jgi:hypothetical protein